MDEFFKNVPSVHRGNGGLIPAIDVYDAKDDVVVETALPGVDPKHVELSIDNGLLTIKGSSERKTEVDDKNYYRKEIRSGSFMRQVALPSGVKQEDAKASFKDGILTIQFPKVTVEASKTIKIDVQD
jgi:HSP20 family protein